MFRTQFLDNEGFVLFERTGSATSCDEPVVHKIMGLPGCNDIFPTFGRVLIVLVHGQGRGLGALLAQGAR